jgi:hypothetical protein
MKPRVYQFQISSTLSWYALLTPCSNFRSKAGPRRIFAWHQEELNKGRLRPRTHDEVERYPRDRCRRLHEVQFTAAASRSSSSRLDNNGGAANPLQPPRHCGAAVQDHGDGAPEAGSGSFFLEFCSYSFPRPIAPCLKVCDPGKLFASMRSKSNHTLEGIPLIRAQMASPVTRSVPGGRATYWPLASLLQRKCDG